MQETAINFTRKTNVSCKHYFRFYSNSNYLAHFTFIKLKTQFSTAIEHDGQYRDN